MVSNKHLVPGTEDSQTMLPHWVSLTASLIILYSFTIMVMIQLILSFMLYDIILTASSDALRNSIMSKLSVEFAMKDLGPLSYFLGIFVTKHTSGLFLSQKKYAEEIVERAGMSS